MSETFSCTYCGNEMEGDRYREYLNNWKQPPLCPCRARATNHSCSTWKLKREVAPCELTGRPLPGASRYRICPDGTLWTFARRSEGREWYLVPGRTQPGRTMLVASIKLDDGRPTTLVISREVARAFRPEFRPDHRVTYLDGDWRNCRAENLKFLPPEDYLPEVFRQPKQPLPELDRNFILACGHSDAWICRAFGLKPSQLAQLRDEDAATETWRTSPS